MATSMVAGGNFCRPQVKGIKDCFYATDAILDEPLPVQPIPSFPAALFQQTYGSVQMPLVLSPSVYKSLPDCNGLYHSSGLS